MCIVDAKRFDEQYELLHGTTDNLQTSYRLYKAVRQMAALQTSSAETENETHLSKVLVERINRLVIEISCKLLQRNSFDLFRENLKTLFGMF